MLCYILADDLHGNILKSLFLDTVVYFSLLALISYFDTNKQSSIIYQLVVSELSIGVHKMMNCIGRTCISLF